MTNFKFKFKERDKEKTCLNILKGITSLVEPGFNCIDIGANIGITTLHMAEACKPGVVLAVEPDVKTCRRLCRHIETNEIDNVEVQQVALASWMGEICLYRNTKNLGDHRTWAPLLGPKDHRAFGRNYSLKCSTLDEITQGIKYQFVKMDAQGMEYHILRGANSFLSCNPDCSFIIELWPAGLSGAERQHGPNRPKNAPKNFIKMLFNKFKHVYLIGQKEMTIDEMMNFVSKKGKPFIEGDVVCANKPIVLWWEI